MLNLKSYYRFNSELNSDYSSTKSLQSEWVTAGICDYIPQVYFSKQYFSIYIDSPDASQIIQSILWNQFYEKTLLKQIYAQLSAAKRQQISLISKLDQMVSKVTNFNNFQPSNPQSQSAQNQIIYLKIHNKIFNLKDKLEFQSHTELEKDLKHFKSLSIQKISKQGKWKKVSIEFGPYKDKEQFDITFTAQKNQANSIHQSRTNPLSTNQSNKISSKKQSIKNQFKQSKSNQNSITKNKENKQSPGYATATKSMSRSKISYPTSLNASVKKHQTNQNDLKKKSRQSSTHKKASNPLQIQESSIRKNIENGSIRKGSNMFEGSQSDVNILREMNFNSTAKLSNHMSNLNEEELKIPPASLDLRRKQKLKVKQNSIMEDDLKKQELISSSEIMKSYKDLGKNNSVLAQILSKKEENIQFQKVKMDQMERNYIKEIEQLKERHQKETEGLKVEMTNILNEYKRKYENEKDQSKLLRQELTSLNEILTSNKVCIAELHLKFRSSEEQSIKYQKQNEELKMRLKEMQNKYEKLVGESKKQITELRKQKQQSMILAQKYLQKYNNAFKKVKLFIQQEQTN